MAEILELSDKLFKVTMTSMLKILMEKVDNMQEQVDNVIIEMRFLIFCNGGNKNHCNRNEECLWWAHHQAGN